MVNKETLTLLHLLKNQGSPVSGAALAKQTGVSRVALWKRFESLRAAGYPVQASRSGYQLMPSDKPLPWEFPGDEQRIFHFETLSSTMDEALRQGLAGLTEGAVVAERQVSGRGRQERRWESGGGDLLVTLVLRPTLPSSLAGALGLEALCCLADTLEELYGLRLNLHWPNDLLAGDKKVAGVLIESWGAVDQPRFYTVGLGLNVHGTPELDRPTASLESLGIRHADRRDILSQWRRRLGTWSASPSLHPLRWASRTPLPSFLTVETVDGRYERGRPVGFDRAGSLLLEHGNTMIPIRYGESRRTQGAVQ